MRFNETQVWTTSSVANKCYFFEIAILSKDILVNILLPYVNSITLKINKDYTIITCTAIATMCGC